ncbi:CPBP family intramembrane glutamic endopeptidase [Phycisphaerales bacterium AB-hyl4]|uniref:CPBP family intramembrane glutamic endopeptidase n=1 Tax=Natronomicrosphaera hydrolytica TaxID=3242702 RepID=A0ABV4U4P0_9BACT
MTLNAPARRAAIALLLLVPMPSIGVFLAMIAMPDTAVGKGVWTFSKIWLALFPLAWFLLIERGRIRMPRPTRAGLLAGVVTGSIIVAGIGLGYLLIGRHIIDETIVREQAIAVGLTSPLLYLGMAVYWCTINSLLEEYVWRWFVFTRCEAIASRYVAVGLSALFFTLHHIIALSVFFDFGITVIASLGVFVGGATWSWIYLRYRDIWGAYVSHLFADVIIFGIGYIMIFGG